MTIASFVPHTKFIKKCFVCVSMSSLTMSAHLLSSFPHVTVTTLACHAAVSFDL